MIIVRYEGPSGAPGMPEMLDSTSRITTLCRENDIVVGLMTDGRFLGRLRWFGYRACWP
jgi:dihydroxy-acid dehydratase